eukprot:CAMPEP_0197895646 /NCGR_PEP_ID=MMETSP1439-20131203/37784_1 /TAXON_ID=66791 /ORGANISM="Gonyaulax spinifera, Strain CCMP409" /LENGTH=65 /DNA_ID=CAMNT_0043516103 /DNA_START=104 /DNA_END=297 /DNA_ORIENTATION=+
MVQGHSARVQGQRRAAVRSGTAPGIAESDALGPETNTPTEAWQKKGRTAASGSFSLRPSGDMGPG